MAEEVFPERPSHRLDRSYYTGWSEAGGDIVLLYRDHLGKRLTETVKNFEWYFPVRTKEVKKRLNQNFHDWLKNQHRGRIVPDPYYPEQYSRVYMEPAFRPVDPARVKEGIGERDNWARPLIMAERGRGFDIPEDESRWRSLHQVVNKLRQYNVEPLEVDLTPLQRFLTDRDIKFTEKFRVAYLDIETEDRFPFEQKEQNRILSVAWKGDRIKSNPLDCGFLRTEALTDQAEERMLAQFRTDVLNKYDVIVAWNGDGFDFPMLIARFGTLGISWNWRKTLMSDLLPIFQRNYSKGSAELSSFALDSIGQAVLGVPKLDWRKEFRAAHPGVTPTYTNLWEHAPDLLRRYNELDAEILYGLDAKTGFLEVEQTLARISGCFSNAANVSHKVDQMMLREGWRRGVRWQSRWYREPEGKFAGAYVFPPEVGLHENVVALDFKALYPSMMRSFNISPETLVKAKKRDKYAPGELCTCPEVEIDGKKRGGSTFRIDVRGIMPALFVHTTDERRKYQKLSQEAQKKAGTVNDDTAKKYDRLAYAYKVQGLSFYGALGDAYSRFYEPELGEAVTLSGQWFIKLTSRRAETKGMHTIYGDTDSNYCKILSANSVQEVAQRAADFCQSMFPVYGKALESFGCRPDWNAVELEFEDVYGRILLLNKKRYAGHLVWHKGALADDLEVKGLEMQRSDQSRLTREMQRAVLEGVLRKGLTVDQIHKQIVEPEFDRCEAGKLGVDDVVIGKGIGKDLSTYKTRGLHVRLAEEIKAKGREFFVGMKVEYVVTGNKTTKEEIPGTRATKTRTNLDGVTREQYESGGVKYDPRYYWDQIIYPASQRVLDGAFPAKDHRIWLHSHRARRKKLVDKLEEWLKKKDRVIRAIVQMHTDPQNLLQPEDVTRLMALPRVALQQVTT